MKRLQVMAALVLSAASLSALATLSANLVGNPIETSAARRTINIDADTRWVNVRQGEAVKFVTKAGQFAWDFNGRSATIFLKLIAPADLSVPEVQVYIADNTYPYR